MRVASAAGLLFLMGTLSSGKKFSSLKMVQGSFSSHMSSPGQRPGAGEDQRQDFLWFETDTSVPEPSQQRPGDGVGSEASLEPNFHTELQRSILGGKLFNSYIIPILTPTQANFGENHGSSTCYLLVVLTVNNPHMGL